MPSTKREVERTAIDNTDRVLIGGLRGVSFQAYSGNRRFAIHMAHEANSVFGGISERQRALLCALVWRYRRQIDNAVVAKAAIRLADQQARFLIERVSQHPVMPDLRLVGGPQPLPDLFTPRGETS